MCGLTGFWQPRDFSGTEAKVILKRMAAGITHRGPDDEGIWTDESSNIALAHRRLSIVDLSPAGHQPMASHAGRYIIAFNGEIYNHLELRSSLKGISWQGHSDTETLLAGFEYWGIEETLKKTVGMFAIALWDQKEKILTLARDRMGEKPLYYGFQDKTLLFGSELKALKAHPNFLGEIDRNVICLFLRHCYIPAPYSIYKGIKKLLPGTYIQFPIGCDFDEFCTVVPKVYWSLEQVAQSGVLSPCTEVDGEAIEKLNSQMKQSVGLQMMADVPIGAFLSGGVDSSTIVALMQAQSTRPVKTFAIGFEEAGYDEAPYAKAVAQHLGTDHTELYVSMKEAIDVIPMLGKIYDEPFADSSQIPTFLLAQIARQQVTVSLSGDGGDELFCGYGSYKQADRWEAAATIPFSIRKFAGRLIKGVPPTAWETFFKLASNVTKLPTNLDEKLSNLATRLVAVNSVRDLHYSLASVVPDPEQAVIGGNEPATWFTEVGIKTTIDDPKSQMMLLDAMTYLPDDILVKVDRAAMANSLETRIPLLDHRVVEMAWGLPMSMKLRDGKSKWLLRQVLYQYVPENLIDRPKSGFSIPLGDWLRGPLRDWAEALLDERRLQQDGFFNVQYVRKKWQEHLSRSRNNQFILWGVLMFQVWLREQ